MPINIGLLKRRMTERGLTAKQLSEKIGIDESTYYRKTATGGESFSVAQAQSIARLLNLSEEDASAIFLLTDTEIDVGDRSGPDE